MREKAMKSRCRLGGEPASAGETAARARSLALAVLMAAAMAALPAMAGYDAAGGYVTLLGHNSGSAGESTFMTNIVKSKYGWSDGMDPHSGTNYYCGTGAQLCSPKVTNGSFTFPGDSLTIGYRLIALATSTLDIADFRLEKGGYVMTMSNGSFDLTLRGNLTVLGDAAKPSYFEIGTSPQRFKVESALKGSASAYAYSSLASNKPFVSFDTQYVELDDADEYLGTFEARSGTALRLASDLPGTVSVQGGGGLAPVGAVAVGTLALADGAALDISGGGSVSVTGAFSAAGKTAVKVSGATCTPQAALSVPVAAGTLAASAFTGEGVRFTVEVAGGVQTLYAENLEPDSFAGHVTQLNGSIAASDTHLHNPFDVAELWSDGRTPHPDANYYSEKHIWIRTNSVFRGRSLTTYKNSVRLDPRVTATIPDLRVRGGTSATSGIFTSSGTAGNYYLAGSMTVLSRLTDTWPWAFWGGNDGQRWVSSQDIFGDETRAFELRGNTGKEPGSVNNYVELLGDLTGYCGTIVVGTNFTLRLGGSAMPGTVRLATAWSHAATIAADGAEVVIGGLDSRVSTSISVAATNALKVAGNLAVAGTLTKGGDGVFAAGGTATAGAGAALSVAAGALRADSSRAFDGIPISFADGAGYVADFAATGDGLAAEGLYDSASVTAAGTLLVQFENVPEISASVALPLFTVPEGSANALKNAITIANRPRGVAVEFVVEAAADAGMSVVKAVFGKPATVLYMR